MDTYIDKVKSDIISGLTCNKKKNITKKEEEALSELMKNPSIIIRPSDKGSQIVIFDKEDYVNLIENHLKDNHIYDPVNPIKVEEVKKKVDSTLRKLYQEESINKEMISNFTMQDI